MANLRLPIKKQWLDEILSGQKTVEYRDFTDHYISRIGFDPDEYDQTKHADGIPTPIETVTFVNGYGKNALTAVYEVKRITLEEEVDDNDNYYEKEEDTVLLFAIYIGKRIS